MMAHHPRVAWTQVMFASVLMLATLPGRTQGLGLVTEPLLADLRLDRVTYAGVNLWATLLGAGLCFPAGWVIDRCGLRVTTASVVLLFGLAVWWVSAVGGQLLLLFILLLATRALGQSALSVCSVTLVGKWFPVGIGKAMGVYSVLVSILFAVGFLLVGASVRISGWRAAWLQLAAVLVFIITPLTILLVREPTRGSRAGGENSQAPQGRGQHPTMPLEASEPPKHQGPGVSFTFWEAVATPAFWLFALAGAVFNLVSSGLGLFNEAVLAERGFDQKTFHYFLALSTFLALVGQFLCGWLTARWSFPGLTRLALVVYAAGLFSIPWVRTHWQLWLVAVLVGVAGGMIIVIFFSVWSGVFGQLQLGRIQGAAQMLTVISSGLGPVLFAECAERFHSYSPALLALAILVLGLALLAGTVTLPKPKPARQPLEALGI